jgi:hypothetical protein
MSTPTDTGPHRIPTPPGWPGDDPTVPDELGALGVRVPPRRRAERRAPERAAPEPQAPERAAPERRAEPAPPQVVVVPDEAVPGDRRRPRAVAVESVGDEAALGRVPAGRVLIVLVAALVLAMLVNADALVRQAEQQPIGPGRDRALAVWHPVQDVSHVLQLYRIRQVADWAAGNGDDHRGGSVVPAAGAPATAPDATEAGKPTATTAPAVPDGTLRTPTTGAPLRLWVGGDSLAQVFGQSLVSASEKTGLIAPKLHYEISSGLSRPDFYDWPGALADDVEAQRPEAVVILLGANDAQGLVLPDASAVPDVSDPRWTVEYRRRVGALMDELRAPGRLVVWVAQPPMRSRSFDSRMRVVNAAYAAEAASRPWVLYVDPAKVVGDRAGQFADLVPDASGTPVDVRQPDGIHLTRAGGDRLAAHVLALVESRAHLPSR